MRRSLAALLTVGALLASGCGSETSPADDVPALATALDAVDEAVAAGDDAAVRDAVDELIDTTTGAREAGDLEAAETDRILAAAEALLAALGEGTPEQTPESQTPESQTPEQQTPEQQTPDPPTDQGGGNDGGDDGDDDDD